MCGLANPCRHNCFDCFNGVPVMRFIKKIPIHPTFLLLLVWFVIVHAVMQFFILLAVVLVHELGHFVVAKRLGYKLSGFYLAPYGVALNYKDGKFLPYDEVKIALAGPITSLALSFIFVGLWWLFPALYSFTFEMAAFSLFLAIFNLLPAYPLDGGRVFVSALSEKLGRKKALKISIALNIVFCVIFFGGFVITCFVNYNPTLALMVVFLLGGIMESKFEGKYESVNLFNKKIKNFSSVKSLAVGEDATLGQLLRAIDASKLTLFYVLYADGKTRILSEKAVLSLCMKNPITMKIKDLNLF